MTAAQVPDNAKERQAQARAAWVEEVATNVAKALADPEVRGEVLALLDAHNPERDREQREHAARQELRGMELTVPLLEEEDEEEEVLDVD